MNAVIDLARPKFCKGQKVEFLGGLGTIIQCNSNSGHWSYLVEMEMGSEPEMGRIGYETTILLFETDITAEFRIQNSEVRSKTRFTSG